MAAWAPLVYGRTREVDFRFLAIPDDFDQQALRWIQTYINASLRLPEQISTARRAVLIHDQQHIIVGIVRMVQAFTHDSALMVDRANRSLYLFVGYVAHASTGQFPTPPSPYDDELYRPLFEFAQARWSERSFEVNRMPYQPYVEQSVFELPPDNPALPQPISGASASLQIWPDSFATSLWYAAADTTVATSVALGFSDLQTLRDSPFDNVALSSAQQPFQLERTVATASTSTTEPTNTPAVDVTDTKPRNPLISPQVAQRFDRVGRNYFEPTPVKVVSGAVGGGVGFVVGGLTPLLLVTVPIGAVVGWTIGAIIEDELQQRQLNHEALNYGIRPANNQAQTRDVWFTERTETRDPADTATYSEPGYGFKPQEASETDQRDDWFVEPNKPPE